MTGSIPITSSHRVVNRNHITEGAHRSVAKAGAVLALVLDDYQPASMSPSRFDASGRTVPTGNERRRLDRLFYL